MISQFPLKKISVSHFQLQILTTTSSLCATTFSLTIKNLPPMMSKQEANEYYKQKKLSKHSQRAAPMTPHVRDSKHKKVFSQ